MSRAEFLKVREAAERLHATPQTIYEMLKRGDLSAVRLGSRSVRIPVSALEALRAYVSPTREVS